MRKELIRRCFDASDAFVVALMKEFKFSAVSHREYMLLKMISHSEKANCLMTITEISEKTNVSKAAVSQMIKQLEGKKWVERKNDDKDKRIVYVCLTGEGYKTLKDQYESIIAGLNSKLSAFSDEDLDLFTHALEQLVSKI